MLLQAKSDIRKYETQIQFFEKKYALSFAAFESTITTFEQENDYIDWKAAIDLLSNAKNTLKDIESGNFNIA